MVLLAITIEEKRGWKKKHHGADHHPLLTPTPLLLRTSPLQDLASAIRNTDSGNGIMQRHL
jgi:hypothetical protein